MAIPDDEKIARVTRLYEAMNSGDLDAVVEMGHPEIVLVRAGGQGELRGPEALREWMKPDAFASQILEPLEFEPSEDRLLVRLHSAARGAGSGIELEIDAWTVYTFDGEGRITRAEVFLDHEEDAARRSLLA
jgi:ketosteroid isomerase-like protein